MCKIKVATQSSTARAETASPGTAFNGRFSHPSDDKPAHTLPASFFDRLPMRAGQVTASPTKTAICHTGTKTRPGDIATKRTDSRALPPEPLHIIANNLSLVDQTSFACPIVTYPSTLGTEHHSARSHRSSESDNTDRETVLLRLAKDLPTLFFCFNRSLLHHADTVGPLRSPTSPTAGENVWGMVGI